MKSKLVKIYITGRSGSFMIRATKGTEEDFITKDQHFGKALSSKCSNEELGKWVREILGNCE